MTNDPGARLEELVRQYGRLIQTVVARVGGRGAALVGQDIEQAVVMGLWQQLKREQTIQHPASYVYRAAVRETIRTLQRERAQKARSEEGSDPDGAPSPQGDPFAALRAKEQGEAIEGSLEQLAPDRRRAARAHLAGFEVAEIMDMYGWTYQKARNLIARGMADLREALRSRGIHG
jgi:RNA polymerase sigma factor (sigma-70 family)